MSTYSYVSLPQPNLSGEGQLTIIFTCWREFKSEKVGYNSILKTPCGNTQHKLYQKTQMSLYKEIGEKL